MVENSTVPDTKADYHTELRVLILRRGLTSRQLAAKLGVHEKYLSRVLVGKQAGYRLRCRMVRELGFPQWVIDNGPKVEAA